MYTGEKHNTQNSSLTNDTKRKFMKNKCEGNTIWDCMKCDKYYLSRSLYYCYIRKKNISEISCSIGGHKIFDDRGRELIVKNSMKTSRGKYVDDPKYRNLVSTLERLIEQDFFTSFEIHEACILAKVNCKMKHTRNQQILKGLDKVIETRGNYIMREK